MSNRIPHAYMNEETGKVDVPVDRFNGNEIRENFSDMKPLFTPDSSINQWAVENVEYGNIVSIHDGSGTYSAKLEAVVEAHRLNNQAGYAQYIPVALRTD